jgi:hypothetical protein
MRYTSSLRCLQRFLARRASLYSIITLKFYVYTAFISRFCFSVPGNDLPRLFQVIEDLCYNHRLRYVR